MTDQTTQKRFCPQCGTEGTADWKFCVSCGSALPEIETRQGPNAKPEAEVAGDSPPRADHEAAAALKKEAERQKQHAEREAAAKKAATRQRQQAEREAATKRAAADKAKRDARQQQLAERETAAKKAEADRTAADKAAAEVKAERARREAEEREAKRAAAADAAEEERAALVDSKAADSEVKAEDARPNDDSSATEQAAEAQPPTEAEAQSSEAEGSEAQSSEAEGSEAERAKPQTQPVAADLATMPSVFPGVPDAESVSNPPNRRLFPDTHSERSQRTGAGAQDTPSMSDLAAVAAGDRVVAGKLDRDMARSTILAQTAVLAVAFLGLVTVGLLYVLNGRLDKAAVSGDLKPAESVDSALATIAQPLMFLALAIAVIALLRWTAISFSAAWSSGRTQFAVSRRNAAFSWVVPVVNLLVPPMAMLDLWRAARNDQSKRLNIWIIAWPVLIGAGAFTTVVAALTGPSGISGSIRANTFSAAGYALLTVGLVCLAIALSSVSDAQRESLHRASGGTGEEPPKDLLSRLGAA